MMYNMAISNHYHFYKFSHTKTTIHASKWVEMDPFPSLLCAPGISENESEGCIGGIR